MILTLPALALIRTALPDTRIRFLTREPYAGLLELSPLIDRVDRFLPDESWLTRALQLRGERPDVVIDFHGSLRSRAITAALGVPTWRAPGTHLRRRRMLGGGSETSIEPVWRARRALAEAVLQSLTEKGLAPTVCPDPDERILPLVVPPEARSGEQIPPPMARPEARSGEQIPPRVVPPEARAGERTPLLVAPLPARAEVARKLGGAHRPVALLPGARWSTKRWPAERYRDVARRLDAEGRLPVLLGSLEEAPLLQEVAAGVPGAVVYAGGWGEIVAWLERCDAALGNDSGLTHLAEAVGTPVVSLFGPTVPELGFGPRLEASRVVSRPMPCRPCTLHGSARCPLEHHACLSDLPVDPVMGSLQAVLAHGRSRVGG